MKPNQWFYLYYIYSPFFAYSYEESEIHEAGFIEDNFSDAEMVRNLYAATYISTYEAIIFIDLLSIPTYFPDEIPIFIN